MMGMWKKATLAVALSASVLATAAPAEAQRYWHRGRGGGDVAAGAILGGVLGLGIGAAIASSNRDRYYDRGYYNRGYYNDPYYAPPPPRVVYRERYYAPPPPPPRVYDRDYYYSQPRGYYGYGW